MKPIKLELRFPYGAPIKKAKKEPFTNLEAGFYKGYDIRWLKKVRDEHPDGKLVNEYEKKFGVIK